MIIRELAIKLGFDIDKSVGDALLVFEQVNHLVDALRDKAVELIKDIKDLPFEFAKQAEELENMSLRTGIGVEELQRFSFAAGMVGISIDAIVPAIRRLSVQMVAATEGNVEAAHAFSTLGVSIFDAGGKLKPPGEMMTQILLKLAAMPSVAERNAAAFRVFGRGALELIPLLKHGADGLKEFARQAELSGNVIDEAGIKMGAEFEEHLKYLAAFWTGVGKAIAKALIPALDKIVKLSIKFWEANGPLIRGAVGDAFGVLGDIIWAVAGAFEFMVETFEYWGPIGIILGLRFAATWALAALPFIIVAAGILGVILILQDLWVTMHGGKGVIADTAQTLWWSFKEAISRLWLIFTTWWSDLKVGFGEFLTWLGNWAASVADTIGAAIRKGVIAVANSLPFGLGPKLLGALDIPGGGASPAAAASPAYSGPYSSSNAPTFNAGGITINATTSDPTAVANASRAAMEDWLGTKVDEAYGAVSGAQVLGL